MAEIDLESMERLIALMVENDLNELQYEQGELKIELKRGCHQGVPTAVHTMTAPPAAPLPAEPAAPAPEDEQSDLVPITSPMVGTFYASPDPESPPFVSVGASVDTTTTVCLIEAMKVFNEIKADVRGTVVKIEADNAEAVEYGQPLFYVRPT